MSGSEAGLQAIIVAACDCSPAGCIVVDRAGRIVYVNRRVEQMFGYQRDELVGQKVEILVPTDQADTHVRSRRRFFRHATARPMGGGAVLPGRRKNGSTVPLEIGLTPVTAQGEEFVIGSLVDVSSRLAAERRAEQSEHRLVQSQKLEALGNLAGGISHDFNNILLAILGYAELLKDSAITDTQSMEDLDAILEAATRGRDLVKRILGFARQGEGERKPVQLDALIGETHRLLKTVLPSSVNLRLEVDPATPTVLADPSQVHQVIMNLATNAAAAMPEGGTIHIRVEPVRISADQALAVPGARAGLHASIVVVDTGTGMSDETKSRAFEPFFTTKPEGQGTGFGLSLVHGIVSSLGGFIELSSQLGAGTSVRVYLPAQVRLHSNPPPGPVRFRALWVDDDPRLAALGQRSLAGLGFEVRAHTSSLQALEEFTASPDAFDIVVSDNTMPHLSGLAFLGAVRALRPSVPTLMVSGRGLLMDDGELLAHGVTRILAKPFSLKDLQAVVSDLVPGSTGD